MERTMRAVVVEEPGAPTEATVSERASPGPPGPDEVVVAVAAAALNHRDLGLLSGKYGPGMPAFVLGSDAAGTVAAAGPGVGDWTEGDEVVVNACLSCGRCTFCRQGEQSLCDAMRILGGPDDGTFAGYVRVPAVNLHPKPAHLGFAAAAALPLALATAWRALVGRGRLVPGETVLVHGIGGGVALFALQIAAGMGCRVIVTSSSRAKLDLAARHGAAAGIDYGEEDVEAAVSKLTDGVGADLVVDPVGPATLPTSLAAVRKGGRIVHFGSHSGSVTEFENRIIYRKQISLIGTTMNNAREFAEALAFVRQQRLQPVVSHRFPLERVGEAVGVLRRGEQAGKVVLTVAT